MADKPSRAIVLYGDGLARSIEPSHSHLHSLASRAFCGLLSLPLSPPSESEGERIVREMAQLLDVTEIHHKGSEVRDELEDWKFPVTVPISERFMGMRAAIITNSSSLKSFEDQLGCTVIPTSEMKSSGCLTERPIDILASELLRLLGFEGGKALDTNQFDLVFLHVGASENSYDLKDRFIARDLELINGLVGEIMEVAKSGSEICSRLHLSVVMGYGRVSKEDENYFSVLMDKYEKDSDLSLLFPRQSYTVKGGSLRNNVRHHCPMLIAQWQDAVTRRDLVESFSFKDFKEHGGNLTIPADRFLHEIAFKLWKAPKYGA